MQILIRYIRSKGQGEEIEQTSYNGDRINIGRGTDQDVHLPGIAVALSHAQLTSTKSGFKVTALKGNQCIFNGRLLESFNIEVGQQFGISGHIIKLSDGAEQGVDLLLELHVATDSAEKLQDRFKTQIADLNISKRGWSWILFSVILTIGLAIPLSGQLSPLWMDIVRDSALPDDSLWLAGDLHRSHRFIGDQCDACHSEPFAQVTDKQCKACHQVTEHHLDVQYYPKQAEYDECTDCHKEHSESFDLSAQSQKICADCHEDLEQHGLNSINYHAASDFESHHGGFKVSMLSPVSDPDVVQWMIKRLPLTAPDLKEVSHLKFSHQLHLSSDGLNSPEGKQVLQCVDCHAPEPGGTTMLPISMDKHCVQCHQLSFDPDDPTRSVPHGPANEVLIMLREYYGFRYVYRHLLADNQMDESDVGELFQIREARRPGKENRLRKDSQEVLNAETAKTIEDLTKQGVRTDALQWAESKAFSAASNLFEKQACVTCHEISNVANGTIPWKVKPIQLTKQWFPLARFSHEKHELMQCADCHDAQASQSAHDVLMPDIQNCRQCHGGEQSRNLIPSSCTECHQYHFDVGSLIPDTVTGLQHASSQGVKSGND
ncbi:MAG: cytochrome c3 family protein [Aestuariibacter sp.]